MLSHFLHLEDTKTSFPLELLLITGISESNTSMVLQEIFSFYSNLYASNDLQTALEMDQLLSSLSELPQVKADTTAMTFKISVLMN